MAFFRFNLQSHPCTTHPPGVNVWIVVRNSPFYIDIHTALEKPHTSLLVVILSVGEMTSQPAPAEFSIYSVVVKNRREKKHFPNEFRKIAFAGFLLGHRRLFLTTSFENRATWLLSRCTIWYFGVSYSGWSLQMHSSEIRDNTNSCTVFINSWMRSNERVIVVTWGEKMPYF